MRRDNIAPGEYYHIYNRGVNKQTLFKDRRDYIRFLFCLLHFQSSIVLTHMRRLVDSFDQSGQSPTSATIDQELVDKIIKTRSIEVVAFCIMPNHFHLILKEVVENGVSSYMQKLLTSYSKYFNTKYKKSGHVFQGAYRAVRVETNEQMLYLSAYVHRNPRELLSWKSGEETYPWSSYQDFTDNNRWGKLLAPGIILEQYKNKERYKYFLMTSTAKMSREGLGDLNLLH